jgi:hypothetical protein
MRLRPWRGALAPLACALALACAPQPPPPEPAPAPPAPPAARLEPAPEPGPARLDRFCAAITRIVAAEARGFVELRGTPDGPRGWSGRVLPDGMTECRVEGDSYPGATYVCRGAASWGGEPSQLERPFLALAGDLDRCLARPGPGERGWQRGRTFDLAGGERLVTWRQGGSFHRPAVSLKLEEEIGRDIHYLRLAVLTMR